uniref:NADH-ubiquinone oxidoreductase chain 5 n=1 Tax=Gammarus duebeni TaxID=178002 RepID=H9M5R6_9CRUS|nr:NADH dehydrogenase subunit 5 [Gammarus duebeni]AER12195.1 NADH dehydrogenase subunit 5 [Gammarus duebeni]
MNIKLVVYNMASILLLVIGLLAFVSGFLSIMATYNLIIEWEIWSFSSSIISMSLVFDWMSLFFLGSVCLISGSTMKYCEYYMEGEYNTMRFVIILIMFVASMWVLIISPNMISLLLGWDGLGLTSYALVIFYQSESSCNAGMLTVLSNRVGDVAVLLSIALMFTYGSWDFFSLSYNGEMGLVSLVILASITKSAQLPFSAWLPAAMAAPTPVSALVHSSTLVTAGVYLLIRFSDVIYMSGAGQTLLVVSVATMVMAGTGAMFEGDMKKIVALSTLSQLGFMIMILSVGMKELAFFHLVTHAMFKSTLFMCAGFMIHSASGSQDSRVMSGFSSASPVLGVVLSGTNLALCGFPFLAGFYSKDCGLEYMFMDSSNFMVTLMVVLGTGLTVAYSFRVLYLSSLRVSSSGCASSLSDLSLLSVMAMSILFISTLTMGFLMYWLVVPVGLPFFLTNAQKFFVLAVSLLGGLGMYSFMQSTKIPYNSKFKLSEMLVSNMWFVPFFSTKLPVTVAMRMGFVSVNLVDSGWLEHYGGQGGRLTFMAASAMLQGAQRSGMVSSFMVSSLVGAGLLLSFA